MESQIAYRKRLSLVTDKYCREKEADRKKINQQQIIDDIVCIIIFILFMVIVGSAESIVDFVLSLLCR